MNNPDEKILYLIDLLIFEKKISSKRNFCQDIGILEQTISKIKKGNTHFTVMHIQNICKRYNVDSNWIFGLENNIFRKTKEPIK